MNDLQLVDFLVEVTKDVGGYLREAFRSVSVVETKSTSADLVTEHDRRAEHLIRERLVAELSGVRIVGEELPSSGTGPLTCYVDPIDGTSNFVAGIPFYAISIGVERHGELVAGVVHDPERNETFWATQQEAFLNGKPLGATRVSSDGEATALVTWPYEGIDAGPRVAEGAAEMLRSFRCVRRLGSAALGLAYVAAGRADVASELVARPWDVAAGFLLVEAAGGSVMRADEGEPVWYSPRYAAHSAGFDLGNSSILKVMQ